MSVPTVSGPRPHFRMIPVMFTWDGERRVMVPQERFHNVCGRQFEPGEEYALEVVEERSLASHKQYFAAVHDGYQNLNEEAAKHFPTQEHFESGAWFRPAIASRPTSSSTRGGSEAVRRLYPKERPLRDH